MPGSFSACEKIRMNCFDLTAMKHLDNLLHLQLYYSILHCKIDMKHLKFNSFTQKHLLPSCFPIYDFISRKLQIYSRSFQHVEWKEREITVSCKAEIQIAAQIQHLFSTMGI